MALIYISTNKDENDEKKYLLSYSSEELEEVIDNLILSIPTDDQENIQPFCDAIKILTELKMSCKSIDL